MYKLEMKQSIIIKHAKYIVERKTKEKIKALLDNNDYNKLILKKKGKKFLEGHNKILNRIIKDVEQLSSIDEIELKKYEKNIFIADPRVLNQIIEMFDKEYGFIINSLKNEDEFIVEYRKKIIAVLGYDDFTSNYSLDINHKIEGLFKKFNTKKIINNYIKDNKVNQSTKYYEAQDYENIKEYCIYQINEVLISEIMDKKYENIMWDFKTNINSLSNSYSKKDDFIEAIIQVINKNYKIYQQNKIENNIDISKYYKYKLYEDSNWSSYHYVFELGLKTCPYCNRQYITPIYSEEGKVRGDIDHFISKSSYPYLSMSIYNLIPCCKFCNSSLKIDKEFNYKENINPFEYGLSEILEFDFIPNSYSSFYGNDKIKIIFKEKDLKEKVLVERAKKNCNIFKLEEIYNYHSDIIKKIILKKMIYSDVYLENICKNYSDLVSSKEEALDFLIMQNLNKDDLDNPLAVLIKDVINFIK